MVCFQNMFYVILSFVYFWFHTSVIKNKKYYTKLPTFQMTVKHPKLGEKAVLVKKCVEHGDMLDKIPKYPYKCLSDIFKIYKKDVIKFLPKM